MWKPGDQITITRKALIKEQRVGKNGEITFLVQEYRPKKTGYGGVFDAEVGEILLTADELKEIANPNQETWWEHEKEILRKINAIHECVSKKPRQRKLKS